MVSNTAMMLMTTSSSISVKPPRRCLPVMVWHSIESLALAERMHVVHIVTGLRVIRRTGIASQAPGVVGGRRAVRKKRVTRKPAQKINQCRLVGFGRVLDAGVQGL